MALRAKFVSTFRAVTLAPDMAALDWSVTVPDRFADICADATPDPNPHARNREKTKKSAE